MLKYKVGETIQCEVVRHYYKGDAGKVQLHESPRLKSSDYKIVAIKSFFILAATQAFYVVAVDSNTTEGWEITVHQKEKYNLDSKWVGMYAWLLDGECMDASQERLNQGLSHEESEAAKTAAAQAAARAAVEKEKIVAAEKAAKAAEQYRYQINDMVTWWGYDFGKMSVTGEPRYHLEEGYGSAKPISIIGTYKVIGRTPTVYVLLINEENVVAYVLNAGDIAHYGMAKEYEGQRGIAIRKKEFEAGIPLDKLTAYALAESKRRLEEVATKKKRVKAIRKSKEVLKQEFLQPGSTAACVRVSVPLGRITELSSKTIKHHCAVCRR